MLKTRNTLKGERMNQLNSAFPELLQASELMRGMTVKEINSFGVVKDGIMRIDLNDLIKGIKS